jgi:hypothetical protein
LEIADLRREVCDDPACKHVTTQRLAHLVKNGQGQAVAQEWWCLDGDHTWKKPQVAAA